MLEQDNITWFNNNVYKRKILVYLLQAWLAVFHFGYPQLFVFMW